MKIINNYIKETHNPKKYFTDWVKEVKKLLIPNKSMIIGNGYGYTPTNQRMTAWRSSDGGILNKSFFEILTEYAYSPKDAMPFFDMEPSDFVSEYVKINPIF